MPADGPRRLPQDGVGLAKGLLLALERLRENRADGLRTNLTALKQDKVFLLFLATSCCGFYKIASREFSELAGERRAAAKLAKAKGGNQLAGKQDKAPARAGRRKVDTGSEFWATFFNLLSEAFPSGSRGRGLLGTQFMLLIMRTLLTVRATKLNTYYLTKAISQASWRYWTRWFVNFFGWMATGTLVNSGLRYVESLLALEMRLALTRAAHTKYLKGNAFYRAAVLREGGLDNVDNRIVGDIEAFSRETAQLYGHSFKPSLEFVLSLSEAAKELGFSRPITLFASQIFITGVLRSLSPSLGRMVAKEAQLEGSFRHEHARLLAHAEEVALLRGQDTERAILNRGLQQLISTQRWHALLRIRKSVGDNIAKFQGLLVGGVFVHIPFLLRKDVSEGERVSSFRATEELMLRCGSAFTEVLLLQKNLDELAGHTYRISQLFKALDKQADVAPPADAEPDCISFQHVSVCAPEPDGQKRLLIKDLTLEVRPGQSVLVTGPNGCGKTSLFRVLAGLWPPEAGTVNCPASQLMWLPQRPYLCIGSLRDQVTYPKMYGFQRRFDERIVECLRAAGLSKLIDNPVGLDLQHEEWADVLSGGERQRIGFARVYFHAPKFAVLDEATSAINPDEEIQLYNRVIEGGTSVFSIAHRLELRKLHQLELQIKGDGTGSWELLHLEHS